jgi:hypothetical protein
MWARWFNWRVLVGLLGCALVGSVSILAWWCDPLRFLKGDGPDPRIQSAEVYHLRANFDELQRQTNTRLARRGYTREWDRRDARGRTVYYQSKNNSIRVYLVERKAAVGEVEVWIDAHHVSFRQFIGSFLSPRCCSSSINACIANLKQIEGAKATWAMEERKSTNAVPRDSDLFGTNAYIRAKPQCPVGGAYTLGAVDELPTCSVPTHYLP